MGCGSCGGGGAGVTGDLTHAITSGDLQSPPEPVDAADATHKLLLPTDGGQQEVFYASYRDARIAQMLAPEGARIRRA